MLRFDKLGLLGFNCNSQLQLPDLIPISFRVHTMDYQHASELSWQFQVGDFLNFHSIRCNNNFGSWIDWLWLHYVLREEVDRDYGCKITVSIGSFLLEKDAIIIASYVQEWNSTSIKVKLSISLVLLAVNYQFNFLSNFATLCFYFWTKTSIVLGTYLQFQQPIYLPPGQLPLFCTTFLSKFLMFSCSCYWYYYAMKIFFSFTCDSIFFLLIFISLRCNTINYFLLK